MTDKRKLVIDGGDKSCEFTFERLYTLSEFMSKYGEDNVTLMLQDREAWLYHAKAAELLDQLSADPDAQVNAQAALDAWKPHDDRPPTELEKMADQFLNLPPSAQTILRKHINAGVAAQNLVAAEAQAEVASGQVKEMESKYAPPDNVGPPIVEGAQEPALTSFEDAGREADQAAQGPGEHLETGYQPKVDAATAQAIQQNPPSGGSSVTPPKNTQEAPQPVQEAQEIVQATTLQHADDVAASEEDYKAPVEQEEGGTEGVIIEPEAKTPIPEE